jgi:hypothetical protein
VHRRALTGAAIVEAIMDKRTVYDEQPEDERYDARYQADATTTPINDDDEWWLPNEADVAAPDAPSRYRPGEGPSDR